MGSNIHPLIPLELLAKVIAAAIAISGYVIALRLQAQKDRKSPGCNTKRPLIATGVITVLASAGAYALISSISPGLYEAFWRGVPMICYAVGKQGSHAVFALCQIGTLALVLWRHFKSPQEKRSPAQLALLLVGSVFVSALAWCGIVSLCAHLYCATYIGSCDGACYSRRGSHRAVGGSMLM